MKNLYLASKNNDKFKLLFLLGSDNLDFKKKGEFVVYVGSHGDKGAEIADIILPSAAYTEQNGLFINLEGRVQECKKASYPIGEAKEEWKIFNLISKDLQINDDSLKFDSLRKEAIGHIASFSKLNELPNFNLKQNQKIESEFFSEFIKIRDINYYFSNSISRASKTMSECFQARQKIKKTGTEN